MSLQLMGVQGPMARHVRDLRLALRAMDGFDARNPWWAAEPFRGTRLPLRLRRRVAVQTHADDPQVAAGIRRAADALANAGYDVVEEPAPMILEGSNAAQDLVASDNAILAEPLRPLVGRDELVFMDAWVGLRPAIDKMGYVQALSVRQGVARAWAQFHRSNRSCWLRCRRDGRFASVSTFRARPR